MEYTAEQLAWIDKEMHKLKIYEYRFLLDNNKYVCDKNGNLTLRNSKALQTLQNCVILSVLNLKKYKTPIIRIYKVLLLIS